MGMGKMALTMVEKNTCVFFEETLKAHGLRVEEVVVFSGLCTELPTSATNERKGFCFIHLTVQVNPQQMILPSCVLQNIHLNILQPIPVLCK